MKQALYRHFDTSGRLLYVGISLSAVHRLSQHKQASSWFYDIAKVDIEYFDSREEAVSAEKKAIETELPLHNIALHPAKGKIAKRNERQQESLDNLFSSVVEFKPAYRLQEAAAVLGISTIILGRLINNKEIGHITIGSRRMITGWQMLDFLEFKEHEAKRAKAC